jgi:hypothetical protein
MVVFNLDLKEQDIKILLEFKKSKRPNGYRFMKEDFKKFNKKGVQSFEI